MQEGGSHSHASAGAAKVKGKVAIAPDVLRRRRALLHVNGDLGGSVVAPNGTVAPADATLAFVDERRQTWCGNSDCSAVTDRFDGLVIGRLLFGHAE